MYDYELTMTFKDGLVVNITIQTQYSLGSAVTLIISSTYARLCSNYNFMIFKVRRCSKHKPQRLYIKYGF